MGQEERKNKAKLEKTQIQLSTTSNEYEAAVKILEETTGRWNREWKAACDKFQDLEEERLDYMKSSLWSFANIASTVCVSDDASCEKIRLSLEDCDVEKDITGFIKEQGTGQEIPDPPKLINFCRGDINDAASEASDDNAYSVAQFQRSINPTFRTSSPQPSMFESHHDPESTLAQEMGLNRQQTRPEAEDPTLRASQSSQRSGGQPLMDSRHGGQSQQDYAPNPYADIPKIPHNEYPQDGMTQFCRIGPPSERSSQPSPTRPESRDSTSEYSNPTSFSSFEPTSGHTSPVKQLNESNISSSSDRPQVQKKKSGFFQSHSPFRRRSTKEKDLPQSASITPSARNTWAPSARPTASQNASPTRPFGREARNVGFGNGPTPSPDPEPVDPRANFQLNIGNNVFDVASPDVRKKPVPQKEQSEELDPIAAALAELKGVTKQASVRMSADRYHGLATPAPPGTPGAGDRTPLANPDLRAAQRGTPPPSYDQPVSRLGAPQPAFTSKQMQQTTASYVNQKRDMFSSPGRQNSYTNRPPSQQGYANSRPSTRDGQIPRSTSPAPLRSASPQPYMGGDRRGPMQQAQQRMPRAASPNPYGGAPPQQQMGGQNRARAQSTSPVKGPNSYGGYAAGSSPGHPRAVSPAPQGQYGRGSVNGRPLSSRGSQHGGMTMQLASPSGGEQPRGRGAYNGGAARPTSQYYGGDAAGYGGAAAGAGGAPAGNSRTRSQSVAGNRQYTKDGRPILHYGKCH